MVQPTRREMVVLSELCLGTVEAPSQFVRVGKKTLTELVARGWIVPARDDHYGVDGYKITEAGSAAYEVGFAKKIIPLR